MKTNKSKAVLLALACCVIAVSGLIIAIAYGTKNISFAVIWNSLFRYQDTLDMQLIRNGRLPRAVAAALVGGFLGVAGAMLQGVTRNPIAEPSMMGITQGATLAIAIVSVNESLYGMFGTTVAALTGALVSGLLVLFFSMQNARNRNVSRLLLAGTALSTLFISLASAIAVLSNNAQNLAFWVAGGFRAVTWSNVWLLSIVGLIGCVCVCFLAKHINIVSLGEDVAIGLGENPVIIRMVTLLLLIPVCAVCVSVSGNISFVGLIVPSIARRVAGADYRLIMPVSFFMGSALVVWADIGARLICAPYEMPVGLFTSLIGVPFFLWMVRKEKG
ncbi:FecCD family ABC transporter permease [[Clostridium] polysaccharolyticum]|uniref:Iron complex transport system permease protein n=1 Tax=[Clostridium] polysaccharolyticum TaxID=29364 RepID=A0A1H9Y4G0_9FIRM|nr:iron ABC transporter permease [[Clostridium] polysaccharolyticum]SES63570.1 iron complex transport system permease protein [[Clostridium] polysaccharolyticum]